MANEQKAMIEMLCFFRRVLPDGGERVLLGRDSDDPSMTSLENDTRRDGRLRLGRSPGLRKMDRSAGLCRIDRSAELPETERSPEFRERDGVGGPTR